MTPADGPVHHPERRRRPVVAREDDTTAARQPGELPPTTGSSGLTADHVVRLQLAAGTAPSTPS